MIQSRPPCPALRPLIDILWTTTPEDRGPSDTGIHREAVLPTGACHIAIQLDGLPFRLFRDAGAPHPDFESDAVIGGARSGRYLRDPRGAGRTVGALLRPGAAAILFGAPAHVFAERHTALADVWGAAAERLRDGLRDAPTPADRLTRFDAFLASRLAPRPHGLHPAVAHALHRLAQSASIASVCAETGLRHRRFAALFHESVGLTPKRYQRVTRVGATLSRLSRGDGPGGDTADLADIAYASGYADQPHFQHEFRSVTGLTPGEYRRRAPHSPFHLPVC